MNDLVWRLKKNHIFSEISEEDIEAIIAAQNYSVEEYHKDQVMFQESDPCYDIGLIIDGCVQIERIYQSGNRIVMKKLYEGDVFGEALIFSSESFYPATVIARSYCRVVFVNKKDIIALCTTNAKVLENFITLLSDKVIMLNERLRSTALKTVSHKVADYILEKCKKSQSNIITLKETKEDIAAFMGIPRPSLSRELLKLQEEGLIVFDRHTIRILDLDKLEEKLFK